MQLIELDNVIDHFIFINLVQGNDNTGKNMYICRYDDNYSLFFVPWDFPRWGWRLKKCLVGPRRGGGAAEEAGEQEPDHLRR